MKKYRIEDFTKGWIVGDFSPAIINSPFVEVAYHKHKAGEDLLTHYHKIAKEITVVVDGVIEVNGNRFHEGDIFMIEPFEVSEARVYKDCKLIVIKSPSAPGDKYLCEKT